tara:strand:+ start:8067 stop:8477 length:411 start_codon:yes stop_codon:yes gene_type:complete
MELQIRALIETDYDKFLCKWWKEWRWDAPDRDFLPENGTGGFVVYDKETPIVAGFMYNTNSGIAWCDWVISNINYKNRDGRKEAMELLVSTITEYAKGLDKKFMYALIKNKPLIATYEKLGYVEASAYITELIKKI